MSGRFAARLRSSCDRDAVDSNLQWHFAADRIDMIRATTGASNQSHSGCHARWLDTRSDTWLQNYSNAKQHNKNKATTYNKKQNTKQQTQTKNNNGGSNAVRQFIRLLRRIHAKRLGQFIQLRQLIQLIIQCIHVILVNRIPHFIQFYRLLKLVQLLSSIGPSTSLNSFIF